MSLSANKKKGLGIILSSVVGIIVGIFIYAGTSVPAIFPVIIQSLSLLASFYGISISYKEDV